MSVSIIVSHRLTGGCCDAGRAALASIVPQLERHTRLVHHSLDANDELKRRRLCLIEAESAKDFKRLRKEWDTNVIAEERLDREVARLNPFGHLDPLDKNRSEGVGVGLQFTLAGSTGQPIAEAKATIFLVNARGQQTTSEDRSDANGLVEVVFDERMWMPVGAYIEPKSGFWGVFGQAPRHGEAVTLTPIVENGPLGWWHHLMGMTRTGTERGRGIKIGIVDTGLGAHPDLANIRGVGAVINGQFLPGPDAAKDVEEHGTHVAGTIGAIPVPDSRGYAGLASGADIGVIRVFPKAGAPASQADIATAIDVFALEEKVDLINLSLAGSTPSEIERDAILAAAEAGSLCIAAAGNNNGQPIGYPAAFSEVAAISALGAYGVPPDGTWAAMSVPRRPDQILPNGLYVANFSNVGMAMSATAPGVGIISTVPARPGHPAPFMEMSGTSMAAPLSTAGLATILANDSTYLELPRGTRRTQRAWQALFETALPLPLAWPFVGRGLVRTYP